MKIIAMGGEPATGKSEIVKLMRKNEGKAKRKSFQKLLKYEVVKKKKVIYFGIYDGGKFDGTDRLSMAVQPVAEKFLETVAKKKYNDYSIFFEGDRLFNMKFLKNISKYNHVIIILKVDEKEKLARHESRCDTQQEKFLKSRKTKVINVANKFPFILLTNNTKRDLKNNAKIVDKMINMNEDRLEAFVKKESKLGGRRLTKAHSFW